MNVSKMKIQHSPKKQAGMSLMEIMASLAILAVVVAGAVALFAGASSSETSTTMARDLNALQAATRQAFLGQGTYGANTNLNSILVTSKKVPTTISVNSSTTPPTLTHKANGTVNIAGTATGASFQITLTNVPVDVCMPLMSGASGWSIVKVGARPNRTPPISPATAEADCATSTTMVFTN